MNAGETIVLTALNTVPDWSRDSQPDKEIPATPDVISIIGRDFVHLPDVCVRGRDLLSASCVTPPPTPMGHTPYEPLRTDYGSFDGEETRNSTPIGTVDNDVARIPLLTEAKDFTAQPGVAPKVVSLCTFASPCSHAVNRHGQTRYRFIDRLQQIVRSGHYGDSSTNSLDEASRRLRPMDDDGDAGCVCTAYTSHRSDAGNSSLGAEASATNPVGHMSTDCASGSRCRLPSTRGTQSCCCCCCQNHNRRSAAACDYGPPQPACPRSAVGDECAPSLHRHIPPERHKTLLAFIFLFVAWVATTTSLALTHERVPDIDPLPDVVLDNLQYQSWGLDASEIIIICATIMAAILCVCHQHRWVLFRRIFFLGGLHYFYRAITMFITVLPKADQSYKCAPKMEAITFVEVARRVLKLLSGMGLSINGQHVYCGDYIYSGHTMTLVMTYLIIREYSPRRWFWLHWLSFSTVVGGIATLLSARGHYSIDVLIAYWITTRLWWIYHTLAHNPTTLMWTKRQNKDNFLTHMWWMFIFRYFEANVGGAPPKRFALPLPPQAVWPLRFRPKFLLTQSQRVQLASASSTLASPGPGLSANNRPADGADYDVESGVCRQTADAGFRDTDSGHVDLGAISNNSGRSAMEDEAPDPPANRDGETDSRRTSGTAEGR